MEKIVTHKNNIPQSARNCYCWQHTYMADIDDDKSV